ncbi:putative GTP-binding protein YPT31/YPT8 [Blattamonas nauphoetae]|uniref:GTP-binding protein YPT31/YPT8 n=1 Tax=Blattamonas nauphoetae TaxID=2049346 RepID=A0ABQ9Y9C6_9EUKA|nr:putative GTP-binding protein YPT31/YPT8 [Blattamonas nauphoetae]
MYKSGFVQSRTAGSVLLSLSENDFKDRFGNDREAGQIGWLELRKLRQASIERDSPEQLMNPQPSNQTTSSPNKSDSDYIFKIVVIGDSGVGKTNILTRFVTGTFHQDVQTTIGVEVLRKRTHIKSSFTNQNVEVELSLWDTAGQERFRVLSSAYYRQACGVLLCYDITNATSFQSIQRFWIKEVDHHTPPSCQCILIGNKCDLGHLRAVSEEDGIRLAESRSMLFLETSALSQENIAKAFETLAELILERMENSPNSSVQVSTEPSPTILRYNRVTTPQENGCSC